MHARDCLNTKGPPFDGPLRGVSGRRRSIPTGTRVQTLSTLTADPSTHAGLTGQAQAALTARSCRAVPATQAAVAASSCVLSAVCCPPCGITG